MNKKYQEIQFCAGDSIESAIKELKGQKHLTCGSFNGKMLYSDIDDVESAYKKIVGKTKSEIDAEMKAEQDAYKEEMIKHKESIPDLTKQWIESGKKILNEKYHELWEKCVPIILNDLYMGMELGCCLDIVKELNAGCDIETAKTIIENQDHSGMSFNLVCSMVKSFCDRGDEFVKYVK